MPRITCSVSFVRSPTRTRCENSAEGKAFVEADPDLRQRQQDLKARLKQRLPGNMHEYQAQWQDGGLSTNHIGYIAGNPG